MRTNLWLAHIRRSIFVLFAVMYFGVSLGEWPCYSFCTFLAQPNKFEAVPIAKKYQKKCVNNMLKIPSPKVREPEGIQKKPKVGK